MQSFGAFFTDNKALALSLVLVAGIVSLVILIFLYRVVFGRRLHMAGGRPRQPRLGVIDSFDLDRQRQLVLIRRDNVEHLIMIGGPNDLVIESAFVRMQPSLPVSLGRDAAAPITPVVPMALPTSTVSPPSALPGPTVDVPTVPPSTAPAPPLVSNEQPRPAPSFAEPRPPAPEEAALDGLKLPSAADTPTSTGPQAVEAATVVVLPDAAPQQGTVAPTVAEPADGPEPEQAPETIAPPPPPKPPASRFATTFPPRQLVAGLGSGTRPPLPSSRTPTSEGAPLPRPNSPGPRPFPSAPLTRGTSAASLRRDPPIAPSPPPIEDARQPAGIVPDGATVSSSRATAESPEGAGAAESLEPARDQTPELVPAAPPVPPRQAVNLPTTLDTLESLEEEMAKLLGRPPAGNDRKLPERR